MVIPPGSLVLGVPGRVVRAVGDAERARIARGAATYRELAQRHADGRIGYHQSRPLLPAVTRP
jgi:carbonic anhydrase/acetyltransferase-like protein (isoleucine patch superfamily)